MPIYDFGMFSAGYRGRVDSKNLGKLNVTAWKLDGYGAGSLRGEIRLSLRSTRTHEGHCQNGNCIDYQGDESSRLRVSQQDPVEDVFTSSQESGGL